MIIRIAYTKDLQDIMKMYNSCVRGMIAHNITQWDNKYPNQEIILKDLKNKTYFVAEKNNEIVGGINIDKLQDEVYNTIKWNDKSDKFLVVHRLAVKEEFWNQKIGKKLMSFAENRAIKNNLSSIKGFSKVKFPANCDVNKLISKRIDKKIIILFLNFKYIIKNRIGKIK